MNRASVILKTIPTSIRGKPSSTKLVPGAKRVGGDF